MTERDDRLPTATLVAELRKQAGWRVLADPQNDDASLYRQAADRLEELAAALRRLTDATDPFLADQEGATHPLCGLTQPVTVAECNELNEANRRATELLGEEPTP